MIPIPKLDDRTYQDILDEALRLIPRYSPDWTNHNPSDPGITILELTSWMTELMLYRVNRIPEKNYVAFLNMLGITLRPPQPARALVTFELVDGAERQVIPERMQIATAQASEDDSIIFETQRELVIVGARIDRCFSYFQETYTDNAALLATSPLGSFPAFAGADRVERFLYVGDPRLEALPPGSLIHVHLAGADQGGRDLARLLEWEYWNGRRWRELKQAPAEVDRGEVIFFSPADHEATEVNGLEELWVRGRLAEVPENSHETEVTGVRLVAEIAGEGVLPDLALANLDGGAFRTLDLGKNFQPLGSQPHIDDCFYIGSREILGQPGADVRIELQISESTVAPAPGPSPDLVIACEYFDGKKWRQIGRTTPAGTVQSGDNTWGFIDTTSALSRSGAITFRVPADVSVGEVSGEDNYWIRLRVDAGDFGQNGNYMLDGDRWVWRDERPLRPPSMRNLALFFRANLAAPRRVLSYNDFLFRDHSEEVKTGYRAFQPFAAVAEEGPALYFGWTAKLPNDPLSLYVKIADPGRRSGDGSDGNDRASFSDFRDGRDLRPDAEFLRGWYAERDAVWEAEQRVVWEYYDGKDWAPLVVVDRTKNLTESGFLDFVAPDDMSSTIKFAEDRFWMRARLEMGGYQRSPRIERVLINTVEVANVLTLRDEIIGSSDGTPLQSFQVSQGPMLEGEVLEVLEKDQPLPEEMIDLGDGAWRANTGSEGYWVRWKAVESFFDSGPRSRHYMRDSLARRVSFGDGKKGMVPNIARNNVVCRKYQIGGGVRGNVNAMSLTQLTRAIAYIDRVYNLMPAAGGADPEKVDEAKARAPMVLKSRDRAVTTEDFESLALRASTAVARAKCLPSQERDGEVRVIVLPRGDDRTIDLTRRLEPAPELLRHVKNFLDARRLVATVVHVERPSYVELSLRVAIVRRVVGQSDRLKREIVERLRKYLHPSLGGKDGDGWPFGRAVYKADLVHHVEDIPGLEAVDEITLYDEDKRVAVETVRLEPGELIHVVNVVVVERVRAEML